jgi:hypothetical protein
MKLQELIVTKANGEQVLFSLDKLRNSLANAGASEEIIEKIVKDISPKLYQGISTKKIYRWAFSKLKQRSSHLAAKYKLKNAIMELGPDGFTFEQFVKELFISMGYKTKTGVIAQGKCVKHEIDVLASNESEHHLVECKYHSLPGKISDVKVPLYIHSRFNDVAFNWKKDNAFSGKQLGVYVVTNTRFSPDAEQYARCAGLELISWDYPLHKNIKSLIDQYGLYPLTCLTTLTEAEKKSLVDKKFIFIKELWKNPSILDVLNLSLSRLTTVKDEIELIINSK